MTETKTPEKGWTLDAYIAHNEAMRTEHARFETERDLRYKEIDRANKDALRVALVNSEKAAEKTEQALKEYKTGANEWRDTVKDLIASQQGGSKGMRDLWGWIVAAVFATIAILNFWKG